MATSKLLKPTNVTISIPEFTDQPDQRVNSNCIDKEADAINTLSEQIGNLFTNISNNKTDVASTTSLAYTGCSVTIPANKYFMLQAGIVYMQNQPLEIAVSSSNTTLYVHNQYFHSTQNMFGSVCGKTGTNPMTLYVWGKWNAAGTNQAFFQGCCWDA